MPTASKNPCSAPSRARLLPLLRRRQIWLTCWCLLILSGCSSTPVLVRPEPLPPELVEPCSAGPDYPAGDVPVLDVLETVRLREMAAADCRARHDALVRALPR
jgi:hypothetical protein